MNPAKTLSFVGTAWDDDCLADSGLRQLVLEHYDREQQSLLRYLVFLGIDADTAGEIVQDSFLKLQEHLLAGGDRSHPRAWLYRVAHNLARNVQTSSRSRKTSSLADLTLVADPIAPTASAEEDLIAKERTERLARAMASLKAAQKNCLVLRAQGLKYREIAETLNLSVSTVAENVQRGLESLKELV